MIGTGVVNNGILTPALRWGTKYAASCGGHYAANGSTSCDVCPAGKFDHDGDSSTSCHTCPMDTYAESTSCIPCPAGSVSSPGSRTV